MRICRNANTVLNLGAGHAQLKLSYGNKTIAETENEIQYETALSLGLGHAKF